MPNLNTVQLEISLTLPTSLAQEAESKGLLNADSLESLLRAELERRRVQQLFEAADRLASLSGTAMTEAEIEAEIAAARRERHNAGASGR